MLFSDITKTFQQIQSVSSRIAMTKDLAKLFLKATARDVGLISYLSLGKLRAVYKGTQFNISSKGLSKILTKLFNSAKEDVETKIKQVGDVGSVIDLFVWPGVDRGLSLDEVYRRLQEVEKISGLGSQEKKSELLKGLLLDLDPLSAKFVVRIVADKLRIGFSDMTLLDALSWMAIGDKSYRQKLEHAYNVCADIGLIAYTLKENGVEAIEGMEIHVGIPIRPASAERINSPKKILEKIGTCVAQPKLDGFRLQIHVDKTKEKHIVRFFSRNMLDMSNMFPDLKSLFMDLPLNQIICEGEAISYDEGVFVPFQETVKRKRKHEIEKVAEQLPLKVFIFDVLYYNGKSLLDKTHEQRRNLLEEVFKKDKSEKIIAIEEKKIERADQLEEYFLDSIGKGLEGLVVKRPDSCYQPGKRNSNWIKLKEISGSKLSDTIDCVVLGYYGGLGRRSSFGIGAFLVGIYNKNKDVFQTIAKVGTGLTDELWVDMKKRCEAIGIEQKPKNVECSSEHFPDVWVSPEIVCMVRADEISVSKVHTCAKKENGKGYALRFPRFMGYRPDKSPTNATTASEIENFYRWQKK
ncbi:ATP-dependent DNA ligase [bacterium]|nr:ATP-dependent DNA ligase [bacterium]